MTGDLTDILGKMGKADLVTLLTDIFRVYPHLIDDFDIGEFKSGAELPEKVEVLFKKQAPWGYLSEEELEAHLDIIADRADLLVKHGESHLARNIYYTILNQMLTLCQSFGEIYFSKLLWKRVTSTYAELAESHIPGGKDIIVAEMASLEANMALVSNYDLVDDLIGLDIKKTD